MGQRIEVVVSFKMVQYFACVLRVVCFQAVVYTNAEIPGLKEHFQCTSVTSFTSNDQRNFYNIIYATLHFFVPLLVTVACYACVVFQLSIKARKRSTSSKAIGGTQNGTHDGSIYSNKSTRKCSLKMNSNFYVKPESNSLNYQIFI